MNFCSKAGVVWMAEDEFAAKVLRQMGEFAGLTEQKLPAVAVVKSLETTKFLAESESGKFHKSFGSLFCARPGGAVDIFIERNDYIGHADWQYARLRQIFYLGLMTKFNGNELPVHGALASYKGMGWLFLGRSGMGKSTTMRRLSSDWQVLADDAVYLKRVNSGNIVCYPLPTWSCGYAGTAKIFTSGGAVPLSGVIELNRGNNVMTALGGLERYRELLRGFHDLFTCFEYGFNAELKYELRCHAVNFAGELINDNLTFYRMKINLENNFADLLRDNI